MKRFKEIYQWCCEPEQLFFLFIIVLAIPNVALFFTEQMPLLARICNIVLPVSVYWMVMTLSRKPGKMIWILFPFVFFAAFQLVLLYLFGQSIIAVDMFLNLLTTNSGEAMELLDNLLPAVIGVFVVYLPTLALGIVSITGDKKLDSCFLYRQRRYARMVMGVGVILTALCYVDNEDYEMKFDMYPVNVCYNLTLAIERAGETAGYQESSKDFTFGAQATHDKDEAEIYVLVVGRLQGLAISDCMDMNGIPLRYWIKRKASLHLQMYLPNQIQRIKVCRCFCRELLPKIMTVYIGRKVSLPLLKKQGFTLHSFPISGLIILLSISSEWRRMNGNL